jgi:UDP-N-acetyl-D-glucosamine/UDP-N-acetyl-D-galactosamine dehydrogenase
MSSEVRIAVIGLGYVGLPVALAFAREFPGTVGFDVSHARVQALRGGVDYNGDTPSAELKQTKLTFSSDQNDLRGANFFVVAVPTPIDDFKRPDLGALLCASEIVGRVISRGATVVFESTVYPGVTEEICGPAIAQASGLKQGVDFKLGYSPERINPGDTEHVLERVVKVVSGQDAETLEMVASVYGAVVTAGVHRTPSIKVAEAAKVIENTQRDLNIALMNELAIIFDRLSVSTNDVLKAAGTKWNFLPFTPGLVGGHCIGVDPYYLTTKAEQLGYRPQVILAGRRINDGMGQFIAQRTVKLMIHAGLPVKGARVGVLGLTFKENVSDIRNSRIPDIAAELVEFGVIPLVHDPMVNTEEAERAYGMSLVSWEALSKLDALILAVGHQCFRNKTASELEKTLKPGGVIVDVKSCVDSRQLSKSTAYWSL